MKTRVSAGLFVAVVVLWLGCSAAIAVATSRVSDWFVMTDELLYERLALSVDRYRTPIPRIHDAVVANINQLYPLMLAIVFRHGAVLHGFHEAHVLDAFVMSSAALPAYLLARRVTQSAWLPFVVAVATIAVPWITLSSFLLTEVVAYPAFAWAALAMQASLARPSVRNDLFAVAALVLAVLARTQFYALAAILPLAIVAEAAVDRRWRRSAREHVVLLAAYVLAALLAVIFAATGHNILGLYTQAANGNPLPVEILRSAPEHIAVVALGSGLLPFVVGGAWAVSNLARSESSERRAFAWLTVIAVVLLTFEVASFDLRFGGGLVHDRYLFYVTPLLLVAFAAALTAERTPRWSLAVPLTVLALGFSFAPFATFQKLNADTPASVLDDWLRSTMHGLNGARIFVILAAVVLAVLFVEANALLSRAVVTGALCALLLVALPAETAYAFKRLFAVNGTSGLPVTLDQSVVFGWVDREITTHSDAVMVPYPVIRQDYWSNIGYWWDFEFWNRSVDRQAAPNGAFAGTSAGSFPNIDLKFNPQTGKANVDLNSYIAQAQTDARFHVEGRLLTTMRGVSIVFPDRPWRADWVTYGIYDDGWTYPNRAARIRVFAEPGQRRPLLRTLAVTMLAPGNASRPVVLRSNAGSWRAAVVPSGTVETATVCVPAHGYADLSLRAAGSSPIYGDQANLASFGQPRSAGVLLDDISLQPPTTTTCASTR